MRHRIGKRLAAILVVAALVACAGTLMGASERVFKITAPADGAQVQGSVIVRLLAKGYDDIAYVIFGVDETRPHSANSLPYRYTLNTEALGNGSHILSAQAYNHYGLLALAKPVTIVVGNAAPKPKPLEPGPVIFAPPAAAPVAAPAAPEAEARGEASGVKSEAPEAATAPEPKPAAQPIVVAAGAAAAAPGAPQAAPAQAVAAPVAQAECETTPAVVVSPQRPDSLTITVDGAPMTREPAPELRSGVAFAALRGIVDRIGGRLGWNHLEKRATAETAQARIVLTVGSATALVDDQSVPLNGSVFLKDGRTMAPVRPCAEALEMRVAYQPRTMIVTLVSPDANPEIGMLMK